MLGWTGLELSDLNKRRRSDEGARKNKLRRFDSEEMQV